jgi:hypothetical protein
MTLGKMTTIAALASLAAAAVGCADVEPDTVAVGREIYVPAVTAWNRGDEVEFPETATSVHIQFTPGVDEGWDYAWQIVDDEIRAIFLVADRDILEFTDKVVVNVEGVGYTMTPYTTGGQGNGQVLVPSIPPPPRGGTHFTPEYAAAVLEASQQFVETNMKLHTRLAELQVFEK